MPYEVIKPPFTLDFWNMSKPELRDYARWFHGSIPTRLEQLEQAVLGTLGYEGWCASYEPDSLLKLGEWFAKEVATRPRTPEEIAKLRLDSQLMEGESASEELTNRTFSLAMDIGMYFARTLERAHPHLKWEQDLDKKKSAYFGQPVLTGFKAGVPMNPVRIAVTLAYAFAQGERGGDRLKELFDFWSEKVVQQTH